MEIEGSSEAILLYTD